MSELSSEFDRDVAVVEVGEGRFQGDVSSRWDIGGNPNGGYVLSIALAALRRTLPQPHVLTVTAHYFRPPDKGPVEVEVERIRSGRAHATGMARLVQDGRERVRVLATFGDLSKAEGPTAVTAVRPSIADPDHCIRRSDVTDLMQTEHEAAKRFDTRLSPDTGWANGRPSGVARTDGWVRFADGREPDVWALPLVADCFPPTVFELIDPTWVPTLELTVHVRAEPAPGWLQGHFQTRALVDGYLEEDGELWDSSGQLVAMSRQLALVLS